MHNLTSRFLSIALAVTATASGHSVIAQTLVLDNFEAGAIRIVQPNAPVDNNKFLWSLYSGSGTGTSITTSQRYDGTRGLQNVFSGGSNWQFQLYTYTESLPGWTNGWKYLRRFVNNPTMNPAGGTPVWPIGVINRMRFWFKVPPTVAEEINGGHNFELGTYIRSLQTDELTAESDGFHFYHFFDFGYTGEWEQVIVDTHPDHIRGANGNPEQPDRLFPFADGNTYFDLMTRFYLDFPYIGTAGTYYMDGFEFYQETRPENVDQVRSMHAVYVPATNEVRVGWARRKDQDTVNHEVRYSFSDIFASGWASATPAPNGTISPPGGGPYNNMRWSSTALSLTGRSVLYVAVKPQNSNLFRQISIPLTRRLSAPANLRVVG